MPSFSSAKSQEPNIQKATNRQHTDTMNKFQRSSSSLKEKFGSSVYEIYKHLNYSLIKVRLFSKESFLHG